MQKKADLLKKEQKKRDHLTEMIKKMESKLLAGGGKDVTDRRDDAKRAREKVRQEMIEHKVSVHVLLISYDRINSTFLNLQRREREIRQQLEAKEESTLEIKGTFTSLQEEVDTKTKKLNKVRQQHLCIYT